MHISLENDYTMFELLTLHKIIPWQGVCRYLFVGLYIGVDVGFEPHSRKFEL